jgi:hypothetical protein
MRTALLGILAVFASIGIACGSSDDGGDGGDEGSPEQQAVAALFDAEELFARWSCSCSGMKERLVSADDACVVGTLPTPAVRSCERQKVEARWDELATAGECRRKVWADTANCLKQACDLDDCYELLRTRLEVCPSNIVAVLEECPSGS